MNGRCDRLMKYGVAICVGLVSAVGTAQATGLLSNVPEAAGYTLAYQLEIPLNGNWRNSAVAYSVDNTASIAPGSFSRIAYYLELVTTGGATQWVYVSMSAFATDATKIGVPNLTSGEFYHQGLYPSAAPTNATILSNVGGITTGTGIDTINLEFWPSDYNQNNDYGVPGAAGGFDFGDGGASGAGSGYGSMQIHNYGAQQTLFAYNDWNNGGAPCLGIGNRGGTVDTDWTFADNAGDYTVRTLQILVGNGNSAPSLTALPASGITSNAATLNGQLNSSGNADTTMTVCWGTNDGGTVEANWTHTNAFPGIQQPGALSTNITGISERTTYCYRFMACNTFGTNWSSVSTFRTSRSGVASAQWMQITLAGYTERTTALTNFPVLVVLSNNVGGSGFTFDDFVTTNGLDLRFFTNLTDSTSLNYEIESWATGPGQASYVWVQVPTVPADGSGSFWMKWGDPADSNRLACTTNGAVWDADFQGVWHMSEPNARDSTANHNHGTSFNNTTTSNAVMGLAQHFDPLGGSTFACVQMPTGTALDSVQNNSYTLEAWFQPRVDPPGDPNAGLGAYGVVIKPGWHDGLVNQGTNANMGHIVSGGAQYTAGGPCVAGVYHHLVGTVDRPAGIVTLYMDGKPGVQANFPPNSAPYTSFSGPWRIGSAWTQTGAWAWPADGNIDEVRISDIARSADWAWASYMSQASNNVLLSYGSAGVAGRPTIANQSPNDVMVGSATLNGSLTWTGASPVTVAAYWGPMDGGTNASAWAHTNVFAGSATLGPVSTNITGMNSSLMCYYRYAAMNDAGSGWAPTAVCFLPGEVTVSATGPMALRKQSGAFTVSRPAGATNGVLVVNYSVSGTATGGVDYAALSGTVTIPDGAASATGTVTILPTASLTSAKTVVLTLQPGLYVVSAANSDTVTLHAPAVAYAGAEITSTPGGGNWGTSPTSGYKKDFRSTDSDPKSLLLPGHPNAYGTDGYIVFSTDKGALYSGIQSLSGIYSNTTPYVASVEILPWPGTLYSYGFGYVDDPSVAIGPGIADVNYGVLFSSWSTPSIQQSCDRLKITFGPSAASAQTIRIGLMTGSGDSQKPAVFTLGGTTANTAGANSYSAPDWYFFDVTNAADGDTLILTLTSLGNGGGQSGFSTVLFDSVFPSNSAPVITAGPAANPNPATYTVDGTATTTVSAAATDPDGDPMTYTWSKWSGAGDVTFGSPNATTSTVSVTAPGTYVLRFAVSDGINQPVTSNLTLTVEAATGVLYAQYAGAEISTAAGGSDWTTSKRDFRSTGIGTKAYTLPGHPNAYGTDGYVFFATGNTSQDGDGCLYTGTRPSVSVFSNVTTYVTGVAILPPSGNGTGQWHLWQTPPWLGMMDDPSLGIGPDSADVGYGVLWQYFDNPLVQETKAVFQISFGGTGISGVKTVRMGVMVGIGEGRKPASISVRGARADYIGQNNYDRPDWYFFDVTNATAGSSVFVEVQEPGLNGPACVCGLVFDSIQAANSAPVISGMAANPAPAVFTAAQAATTTVSVAATDADGDPLTYAWSKISGPGAVAFTNANAATTEVSFAAVGTYVLRASVSDGKAAAVTSNLTVTVQAQAGVPYVTFAGAEISDTSFGPWGTTASSGYKVDFRSTDAGTKAFTFTNHPNAYGQDGYIMFGTGNTSQEPGGAYVGTLYTGSRVNQTFNNVCAYVASIDIEGTWGYANETWHVSTTDGGEAPIDDPTLGIGIGVPNIAVGSLWRYTSSPTPVPSMRITFNRFAARYRAIRIGVRTDRGDGQKPGIIALGGIEVARIGRNNYTSPDWYFFDVFNVQEGTVIDLATTGGVVQGLVLDSIGPAKGSVYTMR